MSHFRAYHPASLKSSADYTVTALHEADAIAVFCGTAIVHRRYEGDLTAREAMSFCSMDCDFSSPLVLCIRPAKPFREAMIRPTAAGIPYQVADGEITVTLTKPQKFSLELDGDIYHNLFVYVNLPDEKPTTGNLIEYGPGAHEVGEIELHDNDTLYLDGDAVVYGHVVANGKNITICGRGVLTGAHLNHDRNKGPRPHMVYAQGRDALRLEGITILDAPGWTVTMVQSKDIVIRNIKEICYNDNSDGLDICSCDNLLIEDCMIRNYDDSISLKAIHTGGDNRNITMRKCILWSDRAHNMLIGPESRGGRVNHFCHILFEDIDVLEHREFYHDYMGVMNIFCADRALFYDIEWNNIRVERISHGRLLDFSFTNHYADDFGQNVRDIRVKNIYCDTPVSHPCLIRGIDEAHTMDDILLENVYLFGRPIRLGDPILQIGNYVNGLVVKHDGDDAGASRN